MERGLEGEARGAGGAVPHQGATDLVDGVGQGVGLEVRVGQPGVTEDDVDGGSRRGCKGVIYWIMAISTGPG